MEKFVQLENVDVKFTTKKGVYHALRDINLSIDQGQFITLIGHSGCGKSTLLNIIAGLQDATEGTALCAGREIKGLGP